jgi:ribosomal protein S18 acetylase RimI-like enzyme
MTLTLRKPLPADVPELARICYEAFKCFHERHGFTPDIPSVDMAQQFLGMMVSHPKFWGVVAAEADGKIVGSNFLDERDPIVGVGPITVDPASQARGVGKQLMQAVIRRWRETGGPGIRLLQDAFNTASMSLYTSLGFESKEPVALVRGSCRSKPRSDSESRRLTEADLPACADLCRRTHGFDRAGELRDAINSPFAPIGLDRGGRIVAYCSSPNFWIPNHGVAETNQDLFDLLTGASSLTGQPVWFLLPIRNAELFRWALSEGLRVMKPMTLMAIGQYQEPRGSFFPSVAY